MTSPYAFYQFWLNADDRDVDRYLRYFSFRSRDELEELEKATAERPAARTAQRALAEELTTLVHGAEETRQAIAASQALFGRGSLDELAPETLRAALTEAGLVRLSGELPDVAGLLQESGLVASIKEARRVIAEGGAYVNNDAGHRRGRHGVARPTCCTAGTWCCAGASAPSRALSWANSPRVDDVTGDASGGFDDHRAGRVTFSLPARNGRNRRKS